MKEAKIQNIQRPELSEYENELKGKKYQAEEPEQAWYCNLAA